MYTPVKLAAYIHRLRLSSSRYYRLRACRLARICLADDPDEPESQLLASLINIERAGGNADSHAMHSRPAWNIPA